MLRRESAFSLIELLISMAIMGTMMVAMVAVFISQNRNHGHQDLSVAMEQNLRLATDVVTDTLRQARYAAPRGASIATWIPWVDNFDANPRPEYGAGSDPDSISIAACFQEPVAELTSDVAVGALTFSVTPDGTLSDLLDTDEKRLIMIDSYLGEDTEFAHVMGVASDTITVDTDLAEGNQGVGKAYPAGTPICRVDVVTFSIADDPSTGIPRLLRDENQGAGPQPVAEGINDLQFTVPAPRRYQVTVTAQMEKRDPLTGKFETAEVMRTLSTNVSLRN